MAAARRSIIWFRRDLRLADHPALIAAGADGQQVVPVFVVDPTFASSGAPRLAYLHDCLRSLDAAIRERSGTGLVIRHGDPADVIPAAAADFDADTVFVSRDYSPYGRRRDAAVQAALGAATPTPQRCRVAVRRDAWCRHEGRWHAVRGVHTVLEAMARNRVGCSRSTTQATTSDGSGPERVGSHRTRSAIVPIPASTSPSAGEDAAHDLWAAFLPHGVDEYPDQRNLPAVEGTSKLSPALKWGTIHPRQLLADLDASGAGPKGHTVFSSEVAWRDFYADVLFQQPRTAWENLNPKMDAMPVDTDAAARKRFGRWAAGETGFGIVDAGMKQLAATGWMHNRVRMIVASFLVKDLHLPWQWGARWFMQHLVDGDLASNNHGWQWAAGTGTDAAPYFRVFNPTLQQERYDPDGEYVARWVPDPVAPMLDHGAERDEALRRLASIR